MLNGLARMGRQLIDGSFKTDSNSGQPSAKAGTAAPFGREARQMIGDPAIDCF